MAANLDILINATNNASGTLGQVQRQVDALGNSASTARRGFSGLQSAVGTGLKAAAGIGIAGVAALGAGFGAAVTGGVQLNSTLENVEAQLLAFTKDGDVAKQILADIRTEAAKTPFAFQEMAAATASLLPAAKQSGAELMDLVKMGEILAASNPAQGLEGAAFSLREALSGDFTSIIERFNLPRQRLNQLKDEGVPALEAVTIAMREMGLDADLVSNLAGTMTGRWSTFMDTIDTLKATLAQPLFTLMSEGLVQLQSQLDANMPALQEFATTVGTQLAGAFNTLVIRATELIPVFVNLYQQGQTLVAGIVSFLQPITDVITQFVSWQDILVALGVVVASVVIPAIASFVAAAAPVIAVGAALVAGVALLRNAWESNFGGIRDITESVFSRVSTFIQERFGRVISWWNDNLPRLQQVTQMVIDAISGLWNGEGGAVVRLVIGLFDTMLNYVSFVMDTILDVVQVVLQLLTGDFEGASDTIERIWERFGDFLVSTVRTLAPLVIAAFIELVNGIRTVFSNIDWGGIGRAIIDGIRSGITSAAGSLASAAMNAAQGALNGVRNLLGIRSPSKVFEGVGENMMLGMAQGIDKRAYVPAQAMAATAGDVYNITIPQQFAPNADVGLARIGAQQGIDNSVLAARRRRGR